MARQIMTDEEKAGKKIADVISDLRLDATLVGDSLGVSQPVAVLNRLVLMVDGMYASRERFRRALGEAPSEVTIMPKIVESELSDFDVEGETPFAVRCSILSDLNTGFKHDERFVSLFEYADIGFPAAYMVSSGMVEPNVKLAGFIDEAWESFLETVGVEDLVFESLDEIVDEDKDDEE